jgi:bacterioferritin
MTDQDNVIELLKDAYFDELETVMNYLSNSIHLDGVRAEEVKESLDQDVDEELTHARELGNRLKQLGEHPPGSFDFDPTQQTLQPQEDSTDVLSVIEGVIEAEKDAIELYRDLIKAADAADDPVTEDIAVGILRDEEEHLTQFRGFRKEYRK